MFNFREWYYDEAKHTSPNQQVKNWLDAADKLHQTLEKLKTILKSKKPDEKKPIEKSMEKPKPIEKTTDKKPADKSKKPVEKPKVVRKNL